MQQEQDMPQDEQQEQVMPEYSQWTDDWHDVYAQLLQIYDSSELNAKRRRIMDKFVMHSSFRNVRLLCARRCFETGCTSVVSYMLLVATVANRMLCSLIL